MTDLPKCRLCGHAAWPLTDEHKDTMCSNHNCVMNECSFTPDQWRTLMGHSGDAGEMVPFGHLILSCLVLKAASIATVILHGAIKLLKSYKSDM